jgi:hypothetical protein
MNESKTNRSQLSCQDSNGRIIGINRFFSGVYACVNGADALTNSTFKRHSDIFSVCDCIGTAYT